MLSAIFSIRKYVDAVLVLPRCANKHNCLVNQSTHVKHTTVKIVYNKPLSQSTPYEDMTGAP